MVLFAVGGWRVWVGRSLVRLQSWRTLGLAAAGDSYRVWRIGQYLLRIDW